MSTQTGSISFESTNNFSQVVKQNYATLSQIKGQFATCGTGASTAAKVANIVPTNSNWTLYEGATVTVKFTSKNTTSAPTLNVNGTGAKPIKDYNGNNLDNDAYNWPEGAAMSFTYDGAYWRLQDSDLMERVHTAETGIEQNATSILSFASMEDNYTDPNGNTVQNKAKSYVDQTANGIRQTVSSTYATKTELSDATSSIGEFEAPYTEVEWVESNGKQFIQLDWIPKSGFGFDVEFMLRGNTFGGSGSGIIFGCRDGASSPETGTNRILSTWTDGGQNGTLRIPNSNTGYANINAGIYTDGRKQTCSLHGTTYTKPDKTTITITNAGVSPTWGMTIFAGSNMKVRPQSYGSLEYWAKVRIYSLKFYDGDILAVDLIGAIRNSDNTPGLYDKVAKKFWACRGLIYGDSVETFGTPETLAEKVIKSNVNLADGRTANSRLWVADAPVLEKLEDSQQITIRTQWTNANEAKSTELAGWQDSGTSTQCYLKLNFANGDSGWIPMYYGGTTRLTSHYGAGQDVHLTYRENVTLSGGYPISRGWWCDANYTDGNQTYDKYSDTVIAGKNGIKRYTLCMQDDEGKWTSIVNQANNAAVSDKTCYTGGLQLGKILYHITGGDYAAGANAGVMCQTYPGLDFRYSVNGVQNSAATELQFRKSVYLVGTLHDDGLFYLDTTKWWTQDEPTEEDGKIYILVGTAYSSYYAIFLAANNHAYEYRNGKFMEFAYSRINKNQTDIIQTNEEITLQAASTLESAKTYTNGEIATEVTNRNAAINTKANEITSTVASTYTTKTEFNNLEIGGRNLLKKSDWLSNNNEPINLGTANLGKTYVEDNTVPSGYVVRFKLVDSTKNAHVYLASMKSRGGMIDGETYVASAWVRANKVTEYLPNSYVECYSEYTRLENNVVSTTWQRISTRFKYKESASYQAFYIFYPNLWTGLSNNDYIDVYGLKLEKGTKPTDWTPAPEDIEAYTDTQVSSAKSEIKQTTDSITSTVEKINSVKYVNTSYSTTLATLKGWAEEGKDAGNWNHTSDSTLRVGDTVYFKCHDTTRDCDIFIKVKITSITSATQCRGISHGYEDVLPVDTIKSTINQSADSVKIAANHVDIEGAAIFKSGGAYNTATTVVSTQTQWYSSTGTGSTTGSNSGWVTTQPEVAAGRYIWQRELVTYADGHTEYKPSEAGICTQAQTDLSSYSTTAEANNLYDTKGAASMAEQNAKSYTDTNAAPKTSAVSRTQRIYYRTNTALSSTITGPTTWIIKNDNGFNTSAPTTAVTGWSTKPTPLAASTAANATKYLYLYTCTQTQTVLQAANNGTQCSASTVLLDDTETIIDGGKIITGSIEANSIKANSIGADQINASAITISSFSDANNYATKDDLGNAFDPIASKTYTSLIGTSANNAAECSFYFAKVHPESYTGTWHVKLRLRVTAPVGYVQQADIDVYGDNSNFRSYNAFVTRDASLAVYYLNLYRATQAGIVTNHKGHALGVGLRATTNYANSTYARTIVVDILETDDCSIEMLDTAVKYANMDGTGSTNYAGLTEMYIATNGQNATNNANTTYNLGQNLISNTIKAKTAIVAESIVVGDAAGYSQAAAGVSFDLSYTIAWRTKALAVNATSASDTYVSVQDRNLATNHGFSGGTANSVVYLVGTVSGSTFTLANTYLTTFPPTIETNPIMCYIPIGRLGNNSTGANYFFFECLSTTLYAYLDGKFRQVTPTEIVATHRIYYRTTAENNSLAAPTTWVDEATTNVYNAWTTKVPPLANGTNSSASGYTKYPYLYTCEQRKRLDGTVECTKVLLDENTTIIDGGSIITNSIAANTIKADSGTFNTANIPDLSAAKITSGDIAAARIQANAVSAINATANKIDAKNINVSAINIGDLAGEIGGRNLLYRTEKPEIGDISQNYWAKWVNNDSVETTTDGIKITCSGGPTSFRIPLTTSVDGSDSFTLSFDYRGNMTGNGSLYMMRTSGGNVAIGMNELIESTSNWVHFEQTFKYTNADLSLANHFMFPYLTRSGKWFEIKNKSLKLEKGSRATDWTPAPEDVDSAIDDASQIASNYIHADSTGINIYDSSLANASKYYLRQTAGGTYIYRNSYLKAKYEDTITLYGGSNASGANPKVELTSSQFKMTDSGGVQRLLLDSSSGAIIGKPDKGRVQVTDTSIMIYDTNSKKRTQVDTNGLHLYDTDGSTESAIFSPTSARIGKENDVAFYMNASSLQAYYMNGSTRTKYFEVSPTGMTYGSYTAASTADIDAIEIGGRNLLSEDKITAAKNAVSRGVTRTYEGDGWWHLTGTWNSTSQVYFTLYGTVSDEPVDTSGGSYVLSCETDGGEFAMSALDVYVRYGNATNSDIMSYQLPPTKFNGLTKFQAIGYRITGEMKDVPLDFRFRFKLEKGDKATAWTPAPEDMVTQTNMTDAINVETNRRKAVYGTCGTGATTTTKVVTCDNFEPYTGARISVKFTNNNTTTAPTLKIQNASGTELLAATAIYNGNAVASATNPVLWGGGATITFVYDGSHWVVDDKPATYSISADSGATIQGKSLTATNAVVMNGTTIAVNFSTANTNTGLISFNLSGTGSANVYKNGIATSSSNQLLWDANTDLTFTRKGQYWYLVSRSDASEIASAYMDFDATNGLKIASSSPSTATRRVQIAPNQIGIYNDSNNYAYINTDGLTLYKGGSNVANFGATARVGKADSSRFLMNENSLQGYNSSNKLYFEVSSSGIKYGTDLTNSGTTYTAATTTQVSESNNAANTIVTVYPTTIDYAAGTATLAVKCMRGTTAITPSAWKWTKGTSTTSIGTNSTLQVTDLNAVYNCTVTIAV